MYLLENMHDAQDVLSESFVYVFCNIHKFRQHDDASFIKWMTTIVKYACLNLIRKRKRKFFSTVAEIPDNSTGTVNEYGVVGDHLYICMRKIKHEFRLVMILKAIEEMEHKEIARHLKIKVELSRSYYFRAKMELRKLIDLNQLT